MARYNEFGGLLNADDAATLDRNEAKIAAIYAEAARRNVSPEDAQAKLEAAKVYLKSVCFEVQDDSFDGCFCPKIETDRNGKHYVVYVRSGSVDGFYKQSNVKPFVDRFLESYPNI